MAENQEERSREDLTEEASPYRIEEYRRKGQVAQSKEITGLAALCATAIMTYALSPKMGSQMAEFMREVFRADLSARVELSNAGMVGTFLMKALAIMVQIGLPICAAGFIIGALASFAQIGAIFSFDPITPDLNKLNPISGLQRLFSLKQLYEGIRLTIKMSVVAAVTFILVKAEVLRAPAYFGSETMDFLATYGQVAKGVFIALVAILVVFAAIDLALQRWEFGKNIRMTKQEAKQEHKEREGDPQIKARIRAVQREIARRRMMQAVKKADVIITNPTHIAVALVYEKNSMTAPKVVAKGADFVAQKIKAVAAEAGIPMVENVPLARTLYKTVKVGQYIPRALYQAVAEILAYVYRLKSKHQQFERGTDA